MNGRWRKPAIQGRQKAQLKSYFAKAGVPWIYDAERPECHENSTYNRKPKGSAFKNNYETRLAMIRKNLSTMDEKLMKLRVDRFQNKPQPYDEVQMLGVYKALNSEAAAGKFKQASNKAKQMSAKEENKTLGIESRKASPVKKTAGSSKGGQLSKKERETSSMAGDMVSGKPA